jgi:hypothetical protein
MLNTSARPKAPVIPSAAKNPLELKVQILQTLRSAFLVTSVNRRCGAERSSRLSPQGEKRQRAPDFAQDDVRKGWTGPFRRSLRPEHEVRGYEIAVW